MLLGLEGLPTRVSDPVLLATKQPTCRMAMHQGAAKPPRRLLGGKPCGRGPTILSASPYNKGGARPVHLLLAADPQPGPQQQLRERVHFGRRQGIEPYRDSVLSLSRFGSDNRRREVDERRSAWRRRKKDMNRISPRPGFARAHEPGATQ
jgi:hypothetical protein